MRGGRRVLSVTACGADIGRFAQRPLTFPLIAGSAQAATVVALNFPSSKLRALPALALPQKEARSRMPKSKATDMTAEQKAALRAYALRNGRFWRRHLWAAWINGADAREPEGAVLRQIRNTHGPSLLTRIGLSHLD